jgi:hypothetical protein
MRDRPGIVVASSVCAFRDDYPGTGAVLAGLLRPGGVFCSVGLGHARRGELLICPVI